MNIKEELRVMIVDDSKEDAFDLVNYLEMINGIKLVGIVHNSSKALGMINELKPDILFLDVEMPGKTGLDIMDTINNNNTGHFIAVVFYTAYDTYILDALRKSAFDYLLKPTNENELKETILRIKKRLNSRSDLSRKTHSHDPKQVIAVSTHIGLKFILKSEIVYFECKHQDKENRVSWVVVLNNENILRLRSDTKAVTILNQLKDDNFIQLSQSLIVNLAFVSMIEYKSHLCYLFPPFNGNPLKISRRLLTSIKERFDGI